MKGNRQRAVVVGAGRAGTAAVEQLRAAGFDGEVVVLHDETTPPYDRPACAKGVLSGKQRPSDVAIPMDPRLDVRWRLGCSAAGLDPAAKVLTTDQGDEIVYDGLVIATGATPVIPPGWPVGQPGFHVLYSLADAWRLRVELRTASVVAVVGGGLTGCEVASFVCSTGRACVLVDPSDRVLGRPLGPMVGALVTDELVRQRVDLRLGRRVRKVEPVGRRWMLVLDDGSEVVADAVVATVGERPGTNWLTGTPGLDTTDGVLCDERLRVVGAPDVVAAGTVARWPNLQYSTRPVRVGQWITAWEHGRAAAATLLGGEPPGGAVTHVPRFWSEQFGMRIQVIGILPADGEVRVTYLRPGRRDVARSGVLVSHYGDTGLEGVVAVNALRAFTSMARGLLASSGAAKHAVTEILTPIEASVRTTNEAPRLAAVG